MTEEEIEKKAEEYANKIEKELLEEYSDVSETLRELVTVPTPHRKQGFIDGVKYGLHEGQPKWHDLRKDPNDLPKDNKLCLLHFDLGGWVNHITGWIERGTWYFEDGRQSEKWQDKVIAWCEIPQFKE